MPLLDLNQLRDLLAAINQTDISELTLKSDDFELVIRRGGGQVSGTMPIATAPVQATGSAIVSTPTTPAVSPSAPSDSTLMGTPDTAKPAAQLPPPGSEKQWKEIVSPMVGTFYRSPAPDEPPFVEVGDRIRVGQPVCIIEAMKLMNELETEIGGEIIEILVQNGQPVEFEQPLMRVATK